MVFLAQEQKWPGLGRTDGLGDESAFEGSGLNSHKKRYNNLDFFSCRHYLRTNLKPSLQLGLGLMNITSGQIIIIINNNNSHHPFSVAGQTH